MWVVVVVVFEIFLSSGKLINLQTPQFLIPFPDAARTNSLFNGVPLLCKFLSFFNAV